MSSFILYICSLLYAPPIRMKYITPYSSCQRLRFSRLCQVFMGFSLFPLFTLFSGCWIIRAFVTASFSLGYAFQTHERRSTRGTYRLTLFGKCLPVISDCWTFVYPKARLNAFLEAVCIASMIGMCRLIRSTYGFPLPSFFGVFPALSTSNTFDVCSKNTWQSIDRKSVV